MLETRTFGMDGSKPELKRFVYSNHLQSASLELDGDGEIISYEEYHPYGTTSYHAKSATINATAKRYRYTGKERDEETGLNYHGARYYALWLCRWVSVDPLESKYAPWSSYHYVKCNPINDTDSSGMGGDNDWHAPMASPAPTGYGIGYQPWGFSNNYGTNGNAVQLNEVTVYQSPLQLSNNRFAVDNGVSQPLILKPLPPDPSNGEVIAGDINGKVHIGTERQVNFKLGLAYSNTVGEPLRNSFLGSQGYQFAPEKYKIQAAILGGQLEQLAMLPSRPGTPIGKPEEPIRPTIEENVVKTEMPLKNRDGYTLPSKIPNINSKPSGVPTKIGNNLDVATKTSLLRENEGASILSKRGYDVEQNPSVEGSRNPDYKIGGKIFDCYAPFNSKTSVRNIWSTVKEKVVDKKQSDRVFLNLMYWDGDIVDLHKQFSNYPIDGLKELIILTKNNNIYIYNFNF